MDIKTSKVLAHIISVDRLPNIDVILLHILEHSWMFLY